MPEIGEVARVVHYIRKHLVGKTLTKVVAPAEDIVFGKVGTSGPEIEKALTGKKVVDVGQQGKYFWMIMSSPPHPLMHLGMSGWFKFKNEHTFYYQPKKGENAEDWPPRFWKFQIETNGKGSDKVEAALVDMRRLARVRLINCDGKQIRKESPLKENGPDPVIDKDIFTLEWFMEKCKKKKVPIKAMLLDQANISGIGNWVGDEVLYNAKVHPEQYANTLQDSQIEQLYKSINYVCGFAVDKLSDSEQFPEDWLFKHRWGKGKKNASNTLPNGEKIVFLTVGGRTSAVIPSVQKKTGPVAKEVSEAESEVDEADVKEEKPKKVPARKRKADKVDEEEASEKENKGTPPQKAARTKKAKATEVKEEESSKDNSESKKRAPKKVKKEEVVEEKQTPKKAGKAKAAPRAAPKAAPKATKVEAPEVAPEEDSGRRRSSRNKK